MASSSTSRPRILLVGGVDLLDSVYPEDVGLPSDFACVVWFALLSLGCLLKMSAASAYASSLSINTIERKRYWNRTFAYCVTFAWQRVSFIVIPFCLSVCLSVSHSATYSLPRLIDHNQIWSAGIYLSSDLCRPFWIPYLPYFQCQREICKISPISKRT